jgi:TrmH family RNA methyltransferase
MERISSRQNPLVQRFRALRAPGRDAAAREVLVLLDGEHLLREALGSKVHVATAAFSDAALANGLGTLADALTRQGARVVTVSAPVLAAISPVRQPSGVVEIASISGGSVDDALARAPQLVFMLGDVQDPGNVGSIVRAA